jgi:hypothetical protein
MPMPALIAEATRRSAVVWVQAGDDPKHHAIWQVWHADRMYAVTGGLEQPLPIGEQAVVAVRSKDRQGNLLVRWVASVSAVAPGTSQWEEVVPLLHAARLNAPDGEEQPARWARESTVLCFTPTGETLPL